MFFCPNCNNIFDISKTQIQTGGSLLETGSQNLEPEEKKLSTEDEKLTENTYQDGGDVHASIIKKIIDNTPLTKKEIDSISMSEILKHSMYKKLKSDVKELVYNKIQDLLPLKEKKISGEMTDKIKDVNISYFVCNNCGYSRKIEEGTLMFSLTDDTITQSYMTEHISDMIHSNILPRTRKYICVNKRCKSHTDPTKREAVFFRIQNSYNIRYICTECKTSF
jgi:hypothetical protein